MQVATLKSGLDIFISIFQRRAYDTVFSTCNTLDDVAKRIIECIPPRCTQLVNFLFEWYEEVDLRDEDTVNFFQTAWMKILYLQFLCTHSTEFLIMWCDVWKTTSSQSITFWETKQKIIIKPKNKKIMFSCYFLYLDIPLAKFWNYI